MKVDSDIYFFLFRKSFQVDNRHGTVVIRDAVTAGIGDIEFITHNGHLFGLITYDALIDDLKTYRIDFGHIPDPGIRGYLHGACVSAHISVFIFECEVAAIGDRYFGDMFGRIDIHHLDIIGTIYNRPEFVAVDLNVVTHVAEVFYFIRVAFAVNIPRVDACLIVVIIERSLIRSHIAFVEQKKSVYIAGNLFPRIYQGRLGGQYRVVLAAGNRKYENADEGCKPF